ncbi:TIGR03086 family metal-binding protein [Actinoallomurus rhizosphaericola]|uniref:TIGR03086 family metal-binding protein n=1 Tax=Actinoallomurus rhizosphaericola TaxID=2952536 RepID=UPI00209311BD|nr:TIGR03086 family metal-binding protein [Actinoallomurus rhizosphaericola]MCO5998933.1 TIGR03086 family metal-binding protein [Actinoallomurus rhizosphaericola]
MTATSWSLLEQAHSALRASVAEVADADWPAKTPCERWNVAQVLRHAAGDQRAYAAALTGEGGPEENPFDPAAEAPGDPKDLLESALDVSARAFAAVTPDAQAVPTPLPQGALRAELAVGAAALDAAVHAWDIAMAGGRPSPLHADLSERLLPVAEAIAEPLRGFAFAPALDPRPGDDATAALLRHLGRDPEWTR